ncbi:MAG: hypothetical protein HY791_21415 [Deltaproteobacteria bacterium]|nr:hypothetical protein [Deltaproteobacteria bacterium]
MSWKLGYAVALWVLGSATARADDLGATSQQLGARYGAPVEVTGLGSRYEARGMSILVRYAEQSLGGLAIHLTYRGLGGEPLGESALFTILEGHGGSGLFARIPAGILREKWLRADGQVQVSVAREGAVVLAAVVRSPEARFALRQKPVVTATRTSTTR